MNKYLFLLILFTPLLPAKEKVILQLKWSHQFQFAGYYAAKEKGFYEDAGFNVEIRPLNHKSDAITDVLNGDADFGVSDTSIIVHRLNGKPLVIASTIFQASPLIFLSLDETEVKSPYDLIDKRIMFQKSVDDASLQALLLLFGLNEDSYTFVEHDFDDWALTKGKADVMSAYRSNQPIKYNNRNINVNILEPASYGVDFYGDLLFTTEKRVKNDFDGVQRFVSATRKGWKYALENKEEIARLIISKYGYNETLDGVLQEADATEQLIKPKFVQIGTVFPSRFEMIANTYKSLGMANNESNIKGLLLNDYKEEKLRFDTNIIIAFITLLVLFFFYAIAQRYFNNKLKKIVAAQTTQLEKNNASLSEKNELLRYQNEVVLKARALAEQANESKSLFFANMTHELRTPLHGILNLADFALDDESVEDKNKALKSILSSTYILSNIVNDILDFSKIEAGKLEIDNIDFDLKELIYTITKP